MSLLDTSEYLELKAVLADKTSVKVETITNSQIAALVPSVKNMHSGKLTNMLLNITQEKRDAELEADKLFILKQLENKKRSATRSRFPDFSIAIRGREVIIYLDGREGEL